MLDQVARDAATLLKGEKAMVGLLEELEQARVAPYHIDSEDLKAHSTLRRESRAGRSSLKTEISNDSTSDPDSSERDAEIFDIKSIISAPMIIEGRGIGTINVYNKIGGKGSPRATHCSCHLWRTTPRSPWRTPTSSPPSTRECIPQLALLDTAISMQRQIESGSIYELVANKLKEVVWNDEITFYKTDFAKGLIVPVFSKGPYTEQIMADTGPIGMGITGHVARTGRAELVNDTSKDPRTVDVKGTP